MVLWIRISFTKFVIGVFMGIGSAFGNPTDPTVAAGTASVDTFSGDGGAIENRDLIHVSRNGDIASIATSAENSGDVELVERSDGRIFLRATDEEIRRFDDRC
jgi:hypothetical protein